MFAKVIVKSGRKTPNGYEGRYELRMGRSGTGKLIAATNYWPWSGKSVEEAERIVAFEAKRAGVEVIW